MLKFTRANMEKNRCSKIRMGNDLGMGNGYCNARLQAQTCQSGHVFFIFNN